MSWLDKIKTSLTITTGDGKKYVPEYLNATKEKEYNTAEFTFPNVSGSLVYRAKPKGRRYNLELFFQGADHLDTSSTFETSADDNRAWTLSHPYYGQLTVQPLGLHFDNTGHNLTKITGTVVETITDQYPKGTTNPVDQIAQQSATAQAATAAAYGHNAKPAARDITQQQGYSHIAYINANSFSPPDVAGDLFDAYQLALASLTTAVSNPLKAIKNQQDLFALPAKFKIATSRRLDLLMGTFSSIRTGLQPDSVTPSQKMAYQSNNGTLTAAMCESASTPQAGDYTTRTDVLSVIEVIIGAYNLYLADLDGLQTPTGGAPDSFIPDADALFQLDTLVNYTISNLFNIALNAKQQRSFILLTDSNWLSLAHKLYGLLPDDSTITTLMAQNNAGLTTVLQVPKNTLINYYV